MPPETPKQSDQLPEEAPAEQVPDDAGSSGDSASRESARPDPSGAPDNDDGTATGNPHDER